MRGASWRDDRSTISVGRSSNRTRRLLVEGGGSARHGLTHHLFRFPAKFHPPVVRALLDAFSQEGDVVFDPFCGSGTALVEAAPLGRVAVGLDIDPVAIAITHAKTARYDTTQIARRADLLLEQLTEFDRGRRAYESLASKDLTLRTFARELRDDDLWVPEIPNLGHWFRRYVVVDLARIRSAILGIRMSQRTRGLLMAVFASIIRNASNADPVPVSGLEVTAHMRERDKRGRIIDPFYLFQKALSRALTAVEEWTDALAEYPEPLIIQGSALNLPDEVPKNIDLVLTSPPYHNAVDYYRRHQLEMFWLGLTRTHKDRLKLLPNYVGRPRVKGSHPLLAQPWEVGPVAQRWERKIRVSSAERARDFQHYVFAMTRVFAELGAHTRPEALALLVVGRSKWEGKEMPVEALFKELAGEDFGFEQKLWYPIRNRYMSYSRRNGASIDREYVLVFRRRA